MDFADAPEDAAYRSEFRAWFEANEKFSATLSANGCGPAAGVSITGRVNKLQSEVASVRLHGLDLRQPLDAQTVATIRAALLAHHVVVFPGQSLSREQQFAF